MRFGWDPVKAEANQKKHGIRFADAVSVFSDEQALTVDDPHPDEERYVAIGMDAFTRLLVVVFTWRGKAIRLISAREATRAEQAPYTEREP
ncbi:MAG: BrnT family toxin [Gemmatimonadetes bacterium]|nr:BrnT family toxin [Gemmatimonadota bacterium]